MPSKIEAEATRYQAQLKRTLADGKVTEAEAQTLLKEAEAPGFTEVKALYLSGFLDRNADRFDPQARAELSTYVHGELTATATVEGEVGRTVPLTGEPRLTADDTKKGGVRYAAQSGSLAVGGIGADDPLQGAVGDCYFVSSLAAVANTHPELLERAVRTNRDGTYTVTLWERTQPGKPATPVQVTIDGNFPTRGGQLEYVAAREKKELWPLVFEKAYAAWKGGYGDIEGGMGANALMALTGATPSFFPVANDMAPAEVFAKLEAACAGGGCVVADSKPFGSDVQGIIEDHTYTVLGVVEQNGQQLVKLRNPWGQREPGHDGKDDGVFLLPIAQFTHAYAMVEFVHP
jgi:hypothetical protein